MLFSGQLWPFFAFFFVLRSFLVDKVEFRVVSLILHLQELILAGHCWKTKHAV